MRPADNMPQVPEGWLWLRNPCSSGYTRLFQEYNSSGAVTANVSAIAYDPMDSQLMIDGNVDGAISRGTAKKFTLRPLPGISSGRMTFETFEMFEQMLPPDGSETVAMAAESLPAWLELLIRWKEERPDTREWCLRQRVRSAISLELRDAPFVLWREFCIASVWLADEVGKAISDLASGKRA